MKKKKNEENKTVVVGLSAEDLEYFKKKILKIRADCLLTIQDFKEVPEKEPAIGLDDRALDTKLDIEHDVLKQRLVRYQDQIKACDNALCRIENGSYGVCFITKTLIPRSILEANPFRTRLPEYDGV